jgi:hypothetical protein
MNKDSNEHQSEIILYRSPGGDVKVEVFVEDETIWLTQKRMAELFQVEVNTINYHIKEIFVSGELPENSTIRKFRIVQKEGSRDVAREVDLYNLDMVISVGYRVNSRQATQFRIWATTVLREYIIKGFALDDERLKNPPGLGVLDYFDEMLERIRDIRASERRMYLRVREIFALAADYEPSSQETQVFFQTIQNKLHFAVTGKTAPELISERAHHRKPNMGLTFWKGEAVRRGDVVIAKNYLNQDEISELNRIVTMFLDFAEDQAKRRKQVFMRDWKQKLDEFLKFNDRSVLSHASRVSHEDAYRLANTEYDRLEKERRKRLEAQGEADTIKQLENMAKRVSKRKKKK